MIAGEEARRVRVRVDLLGPFDLDFGVSTTEVLLEGPATIGSLLAALAARSPAGAQLLSAITSASPRRRYCCVFVDHEMLTPDTVFNTPLHDQARVCFALPMIGG